MNKRYWILTIFLVMSILLVGCDLAPTETANAEGTGGGQVDLARSSNGNANYPSGLVVVGTGTVEADPDIAYLTLGVDLKDADPAVVVDDASRRMESILAAVQGMGVTAEDIRTAGYNLWVEQGYDPQTGRPTDEINYHVIHTVRVTVRNLDQIGTILSAAVGAGANSINDVRFSIEDPESLNTLAREKAIADAQKKAAEMAATLGIDLGKITSISEAGGAVPIPLYADVGRGGGAMEVPAAVPLPAGSFSVSISVVLVYELP
jgi:uncharacterized protein YggE